MNMYDRIEQAQEELKDRITEIWEKYQLTDCELQLILSGTLHGLILHLLHEEEELYGGDKQE